MTRQTLSLAVNSLKCELIVKVPDVMTIEEARAFIKKKQSWIIKKLAQGEIKRENHIEREYKHGAVHLLLGEKFTLNVVIANQRIAPQFEDGKLTIVAPSETMIQRAVLKWYVSIAISTFSKIVTPVMTDFKMKYRKSPTGLEYKFATSYWGVCTSLGYIRINMELLRAPEECIEYIMAHELCHLIHQNHSVKFYDLLTDFMPDWRERKTLLDKTITCKM